jgi:immune inhibitor A
VLRRWAALFPSLILVSLVLAALSLGCGRRAQGIAPAAAPPPIAQTVLAQIRRATATPTSTPTHSPTATSTDAPTPSATFTSTSTPTATPSSTPTQTPTPTLTTLELLRVLEAPTRDQVELAERLKGVAAPIPRVVHSTPRLYALGEKESFWVGDSDNSSFFAVTATLRYETPHLYMWVEDGFTVDDVGLQRSAERFENRTYPTNRAFFGTEWTPGVDSDPHISVFNGRVPGVGGYFYSPSEYSRLANPYSNEREIVFLNLEVRQPGTEAYDATLAHEFQHMIHWYQDRDEGAWVNEGLSMLAEQLNGFSVAAYLPYYLAQTDTQLTTWAIEDEETAPHYAASYLFMAYFLDRFGEEALRAVVQSDRNGTAGFDDALGRLGYAERFEDIFADWIAANYLDGELLEEGRYGYPALRLEELTMAATHELPLEGTVQRQATVHQYGVDYVALTGNGDVQIDFVGQPTTRLAPLQAHGGKYSWWSNRGDDSDTMLTREFDLRGVESATLSVWLWYDLEPGWDYGYISISADAGHTWMLLAGPGTVLHNPNGNSFGPAYTGRSGGGDVSEWTEERIDLSPWVGADVWLRFEVVTDDAVNHVGLFLDDVSLAEIGYDEDFESGDGGWAAAGFLRTDNNLPQRYLVQLIQREPTGVSVRRMALDDRVGGSLTLSGLGTQVTEAVLAISALAPATTEIAGYRYTLRADGR